uniref:Uncharacterized protein LOC114344291 n=1 Tax=Diabrotica virgifera virgifera TaxID=50390 RepID=A0A6P7H4K5_DIAVI
MLLKPIALQIPQQNTVGCDTQIKRGNKYKENATVSKSTTYQGYIIYILKYHTCNIKSDFGVNSESKLNVGSNAYHTGIATLSFFSSFTMVTKHENFLLIIAGGSCFTVKSHAMIFLTCILVLASVVV